MSGYWFALTVAIVVAVLLMVLLRQRRLREKYAATWLVLAVFVVVIGAFPDLVAWLARVVGVETPSNLLFAGALVILLGVCVHLSVEATTLEEETRTLAEELALLRADVDKLSSAASVPAAPAPVPPAAPEA
ncbi:DUF2304 domain-containing protein [Xylanimonas protaetiae]|uniref:DUF2304 domain-containing protein n=1 Tax=Xylanimonas protaetiae TaxID=2509457 RepID=A0A4P6F6Q1_9MICO|nr:DUF2304 domain-containing protein [Xylanimonas protaetiae]QAY68897.1 DUF2304 domain-containing protein [Xylanimonas protaetiae]